jgi:hypothetical protein
MENHRITKLTTMRPWHETLPVSSETIISRIPPSSVIPCEISSLHTFSFVACKRKKKFPRCVDTDKIQKTKKRGAKTAMTLALTSPDLVANIASVDNAPVDKVLGNDFGKYVRGMKRIEEARVTRQSEADKILSEYEDALPIRQFLLGNLYRPSSSGEAAAGQKFRVPLDILGKALDHMGDFPFKDPSQVRFNKPALFVRGTKSKYVPDEVLPLVGQFFPRFELVDIDAGHWVISESPEAFRQGKCPPFMNWHLGREDG